MSGILLRFFQAASSKRLQTKRQSSYSKLEPRVLLAVTDLRFATYNALNFGSSAADRQDEFQVVFSDLDADVVVMQEITSETGADLLLDAINAGGQQYARSAFVNGNDSDHILLYNTDKVDLVSQQYIPTSLREFGEYTLSVSGVEFNVYSAHLKASTGSTNEQLRFNEVSILRDHLETLSAGTEFLVAGDMNIYGASEPAYLEFTESQSNNDGRLEDLIPSSLIGEWHNNSAYSIVHSQSPRTTQFGGGATGGLDDRFDIIFGNFGINDGTGLEYVSDSYFVHGNDGLHFNQAITDGTNSSASPAVIQALHDASDHLPVVADFQIFTGAGGVSITESDGTTSVSEDGGFDTYEVVLDSIPVSDVTVQVAPDSQLDIGAGVGNPINLVFTPANALQAQTITVSAFDDVLSEGSHSGTIEHFVTSTDTDFDGAFVSDVLADIADNDFTNSPVVINEIYVNPPDADDSREYIEIKSQTANASLSDLWLLEIEGDGTGAGTIDAVQNLNGLTTGANGLLVLGQGYETSSPWTFSADTNVANLTGTTMENGSISYLLVSAFTGSNGSDLDTNNDGVFDSTPWNAILDSVAWLDTASDIVYSPAALQQSGVPDAATRFPNDMSKESLSAWYNGDLLGTGTTVDYDSASASANLPAGAVITPGAVNYDDGAPPAGIVVTESGGSTGATEGGSSDSYTVVLESVPASDVTITVTPDSQTDLGAGAGAAVNLVFTPANALTAQSVTVVAVDDSDIEGNHSSTITHSVASSDSAYDGLTVGDVSVAITDNDEAPPAGIVVTESGGSTDVTEGGSSDSYTVVLESVPASDVTITVTPDSQTDLGAGVGTAVNLVFTPANALTAQSVTVVAVDDSDVEGNHSSTITHSVSSSDSAYDGFAVADVSVSIADNDAPVGGADDFAVAETNTGGSVSGTYLDTYISDDVRQSITEELYSGNKRSRLSHQWEFNVTGGNEVFFHLEASHNSTAEDFNFDYSTNGGTTWSPLLTVTQSTDTLQTVAMPSGTSGTVLVRVTDTDRSRGENSADTVFVDLMYFESTSSTPTPGVTVSESGGSTDVEEGGVTDTYTVVLDTVPTSNVTITVTPDAQLDLGNGAGASVDLVFTPTNATTPQTLTVTAVDDADVESIHSGSISHTVTSTDADYNGIGVSGLTVNITDNDSNGGGQNVANGESNASGSVSGDFSDTHVSDDVREVLTEERFGGNKRTRLEHQWTFDVTVGGSVVFYAKAFHNSTVEDFQFELSTNGGSSWSPLFTVTSSTDTIYSANVGTASGNVIVRVLDTDRSRNETVTDSLFIDQMYFESDSARSSFASFSSVENNDEEKVDLPISKPVPLSSSSKPKKKSSLNWQLSPKAILLDDHFANFDRITYGEDSSKKIQNDPNRIRLLADLFGKE